LTSTGKPWNQQLNGAIVGSPLLSADRIVVGTEAGNVYFMDRTGQNARPIAVNGKVYSTPVTAGSLVLVAPTAGDAILVALDQTGTIKWSFIPPK
jgi:outer membrane protein assembly factor BamB